MAKIQQFSLSNFRNLSQTWLKLSPGLNLIIGNNAAGKTSIIEAIWLLSTGRSFRTNKPKHLIQHQQHELVLFAEVSLQKNKHKIGMQKSEQQAILRLDNETIKTQSLLAAKLPVQLLTPESHRLLEEGPKARRQFIDWGCFHHFAQFAQGWKNYQRILKQRNQALRQKLPKPQATLWDQQLIEYALELHEIRQDYIEQLHPYVIEFCQALMPEISDKILLSYRAGWPQKADSLQELIANNYYKDAEQGFTQYGVHRADCRFLIGGQDAMQKLSRGQQKLFVCALLLAQAAVYEKHTQQSVIMLIDDLPAELDAHHRKTLLKLLDCLNIQHIITSTAEDLIPILNPENSQCFYLEEGKIQTTASP